MKAADDPVAIIFKTSGPISHVRNGSLRAGAGLLGTISSARSVHGAPNCYFSLAANSVVRKAKPGTAYPAVVVIGAKPNAKTTTRTVTLRRGTFDKTARALCNAPRAVVL